MDRVMVCEVVAKVFDTWLPVDKELALVYPV
jgi:hypothetical protein